jgi:hypothetical protein
LFEIKSSNKKNQETKQTNKNKNRIKKEALELRNNRFIGLDRIGLDLFIYFNFCASVIYNKV